MSETRKLGRRDFNKVIAASFGGLLLGCSEATTEPAGGGDDTAHDPGKHACKGLNSCEGHGGCKTADNECKGKNACEGKGGCATVEHACAGKNECKGQGGCGNTKGTNECRGKGKCASPIKH